MTAPQLPAGWGAPSAPAAPPAQYPPAPAYPFPQQAAPAPAYPYPNQAPPMPPGANPYAGYGYPAQGFPPPAQPQQPAGPAPQHGTLADYANQPESGASFWKFKNPGDTNMGVVSRDLVDTDTVERTFRGQVQKRFDGSSDWVLRIPITNADGTDAVWEVGGKDRTTLKNALIAAGKADGIPAKGWAIRATFTHFQQNQQGQPSRIKEVQVAPPSGQPLPAAPSGQPLPAAPSTVPPAAATPVAQQFAQQQAPQQPAQDPQYAAWLASQQQAPPQQPAPAQQAAPPAAAYPQAQPAPGPAPQAAPQPQQFQPPQGMPADAAAQFSAMLGGAAPQQG